MLHILWETSIDFACLSVVTMGIEALLDQKAAQNANVLLTEGPETVL